MASPEGPKKQTRGRHASAQWQNGRAISATHTALAICRRRQLSRPYSLVLEVTGFSVEHLHLGHSRIARDTRTGFVTRMATFKHKR